MANITNTFCDLLHTVLVNVRMVVEFSGILHNLETLALFFGTQNSGELYREFDLLTNPNFNHSSRVASMNDWWAYGILNCFLYTGLLSLRWILCVKFFARPKSILLTLIAA